MIKNTGKASERAFEQHWASYGKLAHLERRHDMAFVRGLNPELKGIKFPAQPSDYLLSHNGHVYYCEVKSCGNKTSFPFSQFEKEQWKAMMRVTSAGGYYLVFIHNTNTDQWYRVPALLILKTDKEGHKSLTWDSLREFRWLLT